MSKKPTYEELQKKIEKLEKKCAKYASVDEQYRKSDSIYRIFFENSSASTIIIEDDMTVSLVNKEFENLYAASRKDIEGKIKFVDFVHPDDLDFMQHYHILLRFDPNAAPTHYEFRMINKLGQLKYIVKTVAIIPGTKKSIASLIDITERKLTEEALNESEAKYRTLFESASDTIILMDRDRFIDCNQKALEMFGCSREQFLSLTTQRFWPEYQPDGRLTKDIVDESIKAVLRGDMPTFEIRHMRYDQSFFDSELRLTLVKLRGRKYIQAILRDITERKIAENALKEGEAKYRTLFESAIDTIVLMDNEKIIDCNFATLKLFRGSRNQLIGHSPWEFMPEHQADGSLSKDIARDKIIAALKGETLFSEWRYKRCDGTIFDAELTLTSINLHEKKYWQAIIRDITEKKVAEEALIESEAKYRTLFELAHDDMTIYLNDKIVDCNLAALKMFRTTRDAVIGKTAWDFMPEYQPDGRLSADVSKEMIRSLLKGQTPSCEFRYLRGDGTTVDGEVTLNSIILKGERYYHTIIRDITERKQAEEKLRTLTEELKRSNADLAQFAYVASHDLQEPLRMVTSFVQLLQRRYKDKLDKDADEFISFAVEGASWMQKLINDLLKYSRVGTHGKILESTDCNTVVNHAISNLKKTIEENNVLISMGKLPTIIADYTQLVQLFQNLLSNAIKYRSNQQPQIFIGATNQEDHWLFSTKDNGIGIDKEYVNKIFIIFQRLHNKSQYPGTGIGLAICKKIVERHGGRIWVESQPGIGSTFYFTIPIPKER